MIKEPQELWGYLKELKSLGKLLLLLCCVANECNEEEGRKAQSATAVLPLKSPPRQVGFRAQPWPALARRGSGSSMALSRVGYKRM